MMDDEQLMRSLGKRFQEAFSTDDEALESYVLGELSELERQALELRAKLDPVFASRLELYRPLDAAERDLLEGRLEEVQESQLRRQDARPQDE
jgi:anti-sigma factor RsiW